MHSPVAATPSRPDPLSGMPPRAPSAEANVTMSERISTVLLNVPRGLHVLRYVGAKDMKRPPRVVIAGRPGFSDGVTFLFSPDAVDGTLARFGDCAAILAPHASVLLVTSIGQPQSVSPDVQLQLDPLDRDARQEEPAREAERKPAAAAPIERTKPSGHFVSSGHVSQRGDIAADASGWLGSPERDNRIESFAVGWLTSVKGLRLTYGCEMPGRGRHAARVPGQTVGTKGQATPINRVFFDLNGSAAAEHELVVSAAFGGGRVETRTGTRVELSGPTGDEPLTALKVDLRRVSPEAAAVTTGVAVPAQEALGWKGLTPPTERSRVRVFRASSMAKAQ